jgi:hypothetical protein
VVAVSALRTFAVPTTPQPFNNSFVFQEPKDPAVIDWWWIDATNLLLDQSDGASTAVGQALFDIVGGDGALGIVGGTTEVNGNVCGCCLTGGNPGTYYGLRLRIQTTYSPAATLAITIALYVLPIGTVIIDSNAQVSDWAITLNGLGSLLSSAPQTPTAASIWLNGADNIFQIMLSESTPSGNTYPGWGVTLAGLYYLCNQNLPTTPTANNLWLNGTSGSSYALMADIPVSSIATSANYISGNNFTIAGIYSLLLSAPTVPTANSIWLNGSSGIWAVMVSLP